MGLTLAAAVSRMRPANAGDGRGKHEHSEWISSGLDVRILNALEKRRYNAPTAVQSEVIPLVLSGKDVVVRSHTGSGKTAAYLLPIIHKVMKSTAQCLLPNPRAIILVPTRDLANQVTKEACSITCKCAPTLRTGGLPASGCAPEVLREFAGAPPEILVGTPARVAECIRSCFFPSNALNSSLDLLVLDEADMLLSFGYNDDIKCIAAEVQRGCQSLLLSATTNAELERIQSLVLHNPVRLNLNSGGCHTQTSGEGWPIRMPRIEHYIIKVHTDDKLLYCMALLRLGLCDKKSLVFVSHADTAIRLRLFLAKFSISCCALHHELPYNSRAHILQEFNRGVYDYMIAVSDDMPGQNNNGAVSGGGKLVGKHLITKESGAKLSRHKDIDKDFGVVRGIDFKRVRTVINFDTPSDASAYIHQVGRTGRGGEEGTAITFVSPSDVEKIRAIQQHIPDIDANSKAFALKPFEKLAVQDVEALRYRAEDVARSIGRAAVRDARIREIRSELLNSDRLAAHFEENPDELSLLKHDFGLTKHGGALHLNHLPSYLRGGGAGERNVEKDLGPAHQSDNILGKQQVLKFFEPKKNDVAGKKSATGKRKTSQM